MFGSANDLGELRENTPAAGARIPRGETTAELTCSRYPVEFAGQLEVSSQCAGLVSPPLLAVGCVLIGDGCTVCAVPTVVLTCPGSQHA